MKPYYETPLGKLYYRDARDSFLADEIADTVITDPVWPNSSPEIKGNKDPYGLLKNVLERLNSSIKRVAIQLGCNSDPRFLTAVPEKYKFFRVAWLRYSCCSCLGRLLLTSDIAYLFGLPPPVQKGKFVIPGETIHISNSQPKPNHPCPRAQSHVFWIVNWWSGPNDIVFDPFVGSGTTPIVCERLNRKWVAYEIEEKFCEETANRIEHKREQLKMFN